MHLCNDSVTDEIKTFRGYDYAQIGSLKLLEDADSVGYDPDKTPLRDQQRWRAAPRVCPREWTEVGSKATRI